MAYNQKSARRCISDLEMCRRLGFIERTPHFNTVLKCLNDPIVEKYLQHLINVSGIPLKEVESQFAVDSSGMSTHSFGRWLDIRYGSGERRQFRKLHICCGTVTNIITAASVTEGNEPDSPEFEQLLRDTGRVYDVREVSADGAYCSRRNMEIATSIGAIPFFPFRQDANPRPKGVSIWKNMLELLRRNPTLYSAHYHRRSNVESTFHMLKAKFGVRIRAKNPTAQTCDILSRVLAHNLVVLAQESISLGIDLDFSACLRFHPAHN